MKNKMLRYLLIFLGIIVLINIPPVRWIFNLVDHQNVDFSNATGTFTFSEMNEKERNDRMCQYKWESFKKTGNPDTLLYRITPKNHLQIWNYGDYLFKQKYSYPYRPWSEIEINRHPNKVTSGYQDF